MPKFEMEIVIKVTVGYNPEEGQQLTHYQPFIPDSAEDITVELVADSLYESAKEDVEIACWDHMDNAKKEIEIDRAERQWDDQRYTFPIT